MERKTRVPGPTGPVDATEVGFRTSGEHWNEYLVDDGTVIRLKTVAVSILRIDGQYDQEGNPVYAVKRADVTSISAPEDVKREP